MIATVATWGGSPPPVTAPAGFTLKATYTGTDSGGADTVRVYWKRLTAADTGTYQFTWSGRRWSSGHAIAVSGAAASGDPIEAINRAGSASATTFPSTTVTTTGSPLLAWIGRNDEPTSQHTPPTGFTEVQDKDCTTLAVRSPGGARTYTATGASYTGLQVPCRPSSSPSGRRRARRTRTGVRRRGSGTAARGGLSTSGSPMPGGGVVAFRERRGCRRRWHPSAGSEVEAVLLPHRPGAFAVAVHLLEDGCVP